MKASKIGLFASLTAGILFGVTGGLMPLGAGAAETSVQPAAQANGSVACAPSSENWADCWVTLGSGLGSGASIFATIAGPAESLGPCRGASETYPGEDFTPSQICSVSGNTAAFTCLDGCPAGTQFVLSVPGVPASAVARLAPQFMVSGSVALFVPREPVFPSTAAANEL